MNAGQWPEIQAPLPTDPETFLIRYHGGPNAGASVINSPRYTWPLPDVLHDRGGYYTKTSDLAKRPAGLRGALYEWTPVP